MVLGRPPRKPPPQSKLGRHALDIHDEGLGRHVGAAQCFALVVAGDPWRPIVCRRGVFA